MEQKQNQSEKPETKRNKKVRYMRKPWEIIGQTHEEYRDWLNALIQKFS